jgi:hypothetical protein
VDYGAGGLDYGNSEKMTQVIRRKLLSKNNVLIYDISEEKDKSTEFYKIDVLADDTGVAGEIGTTTTKVDIEKVIKGLNESSVVILPVTKEDNKYEGIVWSNSSEDIFTFHNKYIPTFYTNVSYILNAMVTVPKDFIKYNFYVMNKTIKTDAMGNNWTSLSYDCCLNTLDLLELDNTGKAHMYILDNFKDIDKQSIYESFLHLNKNNMTFETILRIVEKVQPTSTKWLEDYIIEKINASASYRFSDYINIVVKYIRIAKKSKDKDVEKFLDMMLNYGSYSHIDGYVRILKALKVKDAELTEYIQRVIDLDKEKKEAGLYAFNFIDSWKTESFKELEDYIYEGAETQQIYEPCPSSICYNKTDEERQRRGLNTNYDFLKNYMRLLQVKGVDKINLIKRYVLGTENDANHFPIKILLDDLEHYVNHKEKEDLSELIALFVEYIIKYDKYGDYAKYFIPEEKQRELGMGYSSYSRYTDSFEPYIDILSKITADGKKKKSDEEWEERKKQREIEFQEMIAKRRK